VCLQATTQYPNYVLLHIYQLKLSVVLKVKKLKVCAALHGNRSPSYSLYRASPAIWDHTVLPATRHRWTCPAKPSQAQGTWFTNPGVMKGWVDLGGWSYTEMIYLTADSHPSR